VNAIAPATAGKIKQKRGDYSYYAARKGAGSGGQGGEGLNSPVKTLVDLPIFPIISKFWPVWNSSNEGGDTFTFRGGKMKGPLGKGLAMNYSP